MKRFVLVTGASGDIGRAICEKLAEQGYSLYLHYHRNKEAAQELFSRLARKFPENEYIPMQSDLTVEEDLQRLTGEVFQIYGIVHNSGIALNKTLPEMSTEEIEKMISLHLTAPILLTRNLLPKMIRSGEGNIVFISSIWGQTGASCETVYSAAKGGQIAFAKALAKEVGPSGIRVNVVAPGAIRTKMLGGLTEEDRSGLEAEIPLGRLGKPEEVAGCVSFLFSKEAEYMTGQVLGVNGGWYE